MKKLLSFTLLLSLFCLSFAEVTSNETFPELLGDLHEPNPTTINIRMIPHTHDDIGWLKTLDQYYVNSAKKITIQGVQYILDSVFPVLKSDSGKRFIYVEMGFFQRWWYEQDNDTRNLVVQLLKSGQFEFINGGYCMNDEASVYYEDSIDQMTIGHQFLLSTFGVKPEVGWHIDPFGHASAQAALFAQMGFKAFFFARIDYQDKVQRLKDKSMEMVWIPNTSQGVENAMFTHVNYYHYSNPSGFNFDIIASDQPIQDNPNLEGYDVPQRADAFVSWFKQMQDSYRTPDLFHTAGEDFHYMAAQIDFKNWDKLFKYIKNQKSYNVNVMYNLPSEYLKAIYPQSVSYPTKTDDFFPYADRDDGFWTGYFVSRVALKGLVRKTGRFLQATRRLATQIAWDQSSAFVKSNFPQVDKAIYALEEAMAIAQHHDAVTGTSKLAVADDYKYRLVNGSNAVKTKFLYPYFQERIQKDLGITGAQLSMCQVNISASFCDATFSNLKNNKPLLVAIYNSGTARTSTIRIKVPNGNVQVKSSAGVAIPTDVICSNSTDTSDCDLFFTSDLGGFSVNYFYLAPSTTSNLVQGQAFAKAKEYVLNPKQSITTVDMQTYSLTICKDQFHLLCYTTLFTLKYNYYESYQGPKDQPSGAYIFRPTDKTKSAPLSYATFSSGTVYVGKNLVQIHLTSNEIIADLRVYNDLTNGVDLQTFVNSINAADGQGREVVLSIQVPSINNNNTCYTDSMGMEMQQRILNYRPTWPLKQTQPVSGNYFPIQSTIYIQDTSSNERFAVIPDRSQGGGSIQKGQIELMIHRRLLVDDWRGVEEPLNETDWDLKGMRQWVQHTLLFTKPTFVDTNHRDIQLNNDVENLVLLAPTTKTPFFKEGMGDLSAFGDFDHDIKLMSRPLALNKFLLRFQNMDESIARDVSTSVFSGARGKGTPVEMSLTYNQAKTEMIKNRYDWNKLGLNNPAFAKNDYLTLDKFSLRPLEIRTFVVTFANGAEEVEKVEEVKEVEEVTQSEFEREEEFIFV